MGSKGESSVLVPRIHKSVFVAEGARIYGDVEIRANSSMSFKAVIRGDEGKIFIGTGTLPDPDHVTRACADPHDEDKRSGSLDGCHPSP